MTLTEVRAMTPEEKRAKLAELLGWEFRKIRRSRIEAIFNGRNMGFKAGIDAMALALCLEAYVPDYCNDLNAVHEAEKTLTGEQCETYMHQLYRGSAEDGIGAEYPAKGYWFHETAEQRTEALILTLSA